MPSEFPKSALTEELSFRFLEGVREYAVFMMDAEGHILTWTPGVLRVLGYAEPEFIGQPFATIFTPEDRATGMSDAELGRAATAGRSEDVRWHLRKDGTRFWATGEVTALHNESGALRGFAKILRDDTERKRLEDQLRARADDLEQAARVKDEFLATLSHELRTPLNAIMGWSNILRTQELDAETMTRGLEAVERNARAQAQLIDDLLDVSRILTGKLRLELRPVELALLLQSAIDTAAPAAQAKKIDLQFKVTQNASFISGDPDRLGQLFWNLLSNAIKFTPKGGHITVELVPFESQTSVRITDSGEGINPEFLPHVFERFRQADSSSTRRHGGLGIGLGLVRYLAEAHGGNVSAQSDGAGKGSTFIVNFPLMSVRPALVPPIVAKPTVPEIEATNAELPLEAFVSPLDVQLPALSGLKILVVDDEPDARDLARVTLAQHGAIVDEAISAAEAYTRWEASLQSQNLFDVIVSDIGMPQEDGYSLIRRIRAQESSEASFLPAVALTAYASPKDRVKILISGFQIHLAKPVDPTELVAVVASLKGRTGRT